MSYCQSGNNMNLVVRWVYYYIHQSYIIEYQQYLTWLAQLSQTHRVPMLLCRVEAKTNLWDTDFFLTYLWDTGDMFSFHPLHDFRGVISFQLAGHCLLSMIVLE